MNLCTTEKGSTASKLEFKQNKHYLYCILAIQGVPDIPCKLPAVAMKINSIEFLASRM